MLFSTAAIVPAEAATEPLAWAPVRVATPAVTAAVFAASPTGRRRRLRRDAREPVGDHSYPGLYEAMDDLQENIPCRVAKSQLPRDHAHDRGRHARTNLLETASVVSIDLLVDIALDFLPPKRGLAGKFVDPALSGRISNGPLLIRALQELEVLTLDAFTLRLKREEAGELFLVGDLRRLDLFLDERDLPFHGV